MEKDLTYFEGLIARYFSGEASPEEVAELSAWVALSAGNESIFKASQHAWTALETYRIEESVDVEEEFQKMYDVRCTMYDLKTTNHESRITNQAPRITNQAPFSLWLMPSGYPTDLAAENAKIAKRSEFWSDVDRARAQWK